MSIQETAKKHVVEYYNSRVDHTNNYTITKDDVYIVWFCYTLGNWKCLLSTNIEDGMYYEVTHNAVDKETYLDAYIKYENICIPL